MTRLTQDEVPSSTAQFRRNAVVIVGELRLGELQFEFSQDFLCRGDLNGLFSDPLSHFQQNSSYFSFLFLEQPHQFVVLLDGFERLDENRLAARTGAMYDTLHAPFLL